MSRNDLLSCALLAVATLSHAAGEAPSFKSGIAPILKSRCAMCHATGQEPGKMALGPVSAYASIVRVPSSTLPSMMRVNPGDAAHSYLMLKVDGTHLDAGGSGTRMPLAGPPLDAATRKLLRDWINSGAPDN